MKEAASGKEIVLEEKIHITETEEIIEEEIPLPVKEMFITKTENDGKDFIKFINLSNLPCLSCDPITDILYSYLL